VGASGSRSSDATPLTDAQIAGVTDFVNSGEIQQAQLAQSKSKDPHVLSFASTMISHHSEARRQQAQLGMSPTGSSVLQRLSADGQRTLATLRDKSGKEFDLAYLQGQVEAHQKVLETLDRQLLPNAKNAQFRSQLQNMRSTVQQHLQLARDSLQAVGSQQGSSGQGSSSQRSNSSGSGSSGQQRTGTGKAAQP
jgi:putative membrane protein